MMIIFIAAIGFFVYYSIATHFRLLNEKRTKLTKHLNEIVHDVSVEKHGDIEYWFDKDTHKFLGQGKTLEEMIAVIKSRFPDHVFLLSDVGGICAETNWIVGSFEQLSTVNFANRQGR